MEASFGGDGWLKPFLVLDNHVFMAQQQEHAVPAGEMAQEKWTKDLKAANLSATDVLPESGSRPRKVTGSRSAHRGEGGAPRWVTHYYLQFHGTGGPMVLFGP
ncbi:unnamed protein product [Arctogadus glacialis]